MSKKDLVQFPNGYTRWIKNGCPRPYYNPDKDRERLGIGFVYMLGAAAVVILWLRALISSLPGAVFSAPPVVSDAPVYAFDWSQYWVWLDSVIWPAFVILGVAFIVWSALLVMQLKRLRQSRREGAPSGKGPAAVLPPEITAPPIT